jgi:hypothetical protein
MSLLSIFFLSLVALVGVGTAAFAALVVAKLFKS